MLRLSLLIHPLRGSLLLVALLGFLGGSALSQASLPPPMGTVPLTGTVTDDTALYQSLSEIRVKRQREFSFDQDLSRLSALEPRYRESLPGLSNDRMQGARSRIERAPLRGTSATVSGKRPESKLNIKVIPNS